VLSQPNISELTVEDPAEAFEDLRDKNDLLMLLSNQRFMEEGFGGESVSHGGGRAGGIGKGGKSGRGGNATVSTKGKMGPPAEKPWAEKWRKDLKIAGVSLPFYFCIMTAERTFPAAIQSPPRNAYPASFGPC
jgi:histone acetyltransferase 1